METFLHAPETSRLRLRTPDPSPDGRVMQRVIVDSGQTRTRLHEACEEKKDKRNSNGQGTPDFDLEPGPGRGRPRRKFEHLILRINQLKNRAAQARFACLSYDPPDAIGAIEELRAEMLSPEETRDRISQILRYVLSDKQKVKWKQALARGGIDEGMAYLGRVLVASRRIRSDVRARFSEDIHRAGNADASAHVDKYTVRKYQFQRKMLDLCRRLMPHIDTEKGLEMYRTFRVDDSEFEEDIYYTMLPVLRAGPDDRKEQLAALIVRLEELVQKSPCRFPENPQQKFHMLVRVIEGEIDRKKKRLISLRGKRAKLREKRKLIRKLRAGDGSTRKIAQHETRRYHREEEVSRETRSCNRREVRRRQEKLRYLGKWREEEGASSGDLPLEKPPAGKRDSLPSGTIEIPTGHEYLLHEDESYVITEESPFTVSAVTAPPQHFEDNTHIAIREDPPITEHFLEVGGRRFSLPKILRGKVFTRTAVCRQTDGEIIDLALDRSRCDFGRLEPLLKRLAASANEKDAARIVEEELDALAQRCYGEPSL
ncbi:MAG: hypothetical protein PHH13_01335 [Candidatus Peribacteraceae bacterium]|nr:hypothetical protein [Candidatus Peribacteraceae bacterium]